MLYNGNKITLSNKLPLLDFLSNNKYDISKIAIELNNQIVPKAQYTNIVLNDSDKIEIVSFVGGG
ncbi:MAG: thiamine biosynthesis protein ThiS [Epulopiscium sp. Nuni2H_MBin003]|nr:MAG: thiamine biosynthesis protein ThiS [Epulopiscium sp. Nuni2H_MBin003]